jgi:hypothetical protein
MLAPLCSFPPFSSARLAGALALCLVTVGALAPAAAQPARTVERSVEMDPDGTLTLETFSGAVEVSTWDRASVEVEVRIEGKSEEQVNRTQIRVEGDREARTVKSDFDDLPQERFLGIFKMGTPDRPKTYYTVRMPRQARLKVDVFSASVQVSGAGDDVGIDGFSADVTIEGLNGRLQADVYSGDLRATAVRGGVRFDSFSGDADVAFDALTDDSSFDTFSGNVTLSVPAGAGFDLDSETGMGDLDAAFDTSTLERDENSVRGPVNGGGPRVGFDTFSGTLTLCAGASCPGSV